MKFSFSDSRKNWTVAVQWLKKDLRITDQLPCFLVCEREDTWLMTCDTSFTCPQESAYQLNAKMTNEQSILYGLYWKRLCSLEVSLRTANTCIFLITRKLFLSSEIAERIGMEFCHQVWRVGTLVLVSFTGLEIFPMLILLELNSMAFFFCFFFFFFFFFF